MPYYTRREIEIEGMGRGRRGGGGGETTPLIKIIKARVQKICRRIREMERSDGLGTSDVPALGSPRLQ